MEEKTKILYEKVIWVLENPTPWTKEKVKIMAGWLEWLEARNE